MGNLTDAKTIRNISSQIKDKSINSFIGSIKPDFLDSDSVEQALHSASRKISKNHINENLFSFLFTPNVEFVTSPIDKDDPDGDKLISYISFHPFREGKKYIILSATANEWMYKKLFGDRVEFIDLSNVELLGEINQFSDKSFARNGMMKQQAQRAKLANQFKPDLETITFKSYKTNFDNAIDPLHFGNCEGSNNYSGQDLKIVGTPHINPEVIKLYCKLLGISTSPLDFSFKMQKVSFNGFEFNFPTSLNEEVRRIQFHFIERELIQSIGRSRLINHPATVYVFSDYPIPQAKQYSLKDTQQWDRKTA